MSNMKTNRHIVVKCNKNIDSLNPVLVDSRTRFKMK